MSICAPYQRKCTWHAKRHPIIYAYGMFDYNKIEKGEKSVKRERDDGHSRFKCFLFPFFCLFGLKGRR